MPDIVNVVFVGGGKTYHFDARGLELAAGDQVIVEGLQRARRGDTVRAVPFAAAVK